MDHRAWFFVIPGACACDREPDHGQPGVIRTGYLPNVTHAQALTGTPRRGFRHRLNGRRGPLSQDA